MTLITAGRDQLDLRDAGAVETWFANHTPEVVVLAAAKVASGQP
jgi:GDP-L-fucose synthase